MDSYEILGVSKESSDKEIEVAYEDLKKKYNPSFNTSVHAYKKYREILKAYEDIKDEKRRKMYDLKDEEYKLNAEDKTFELYDFSSVETQIANNVDLYKVEDLKTDSCDDIEINKDISYLYKLLNLRYDLTYLHRVRCPECLEHSICHLCGGDKVVYYNESVVWCPVCHGDGVVSSNCKNCGNSGYHIVEDSISFYVDGDKKEFKGLGDEFSGETKSNLKVNFNFYDKNNIRDDSDIIEVDYYLNKEETENGFVKEYFGEYGAFKVEIPSFMEDGYKQEINFNNKKIIFTFFNKPYNGTDKVMYLFINKSFKNKFIYFSDDYDICSNEEKINCNTMVKCEQRIVVQGKGNRGKYNGNNGDLIINVIFNDSDELLYTNNVKVISTSKVFNLLGGEIDGFHHHGFKKVNSLVKKNNVYYLLSGDSSNKLKLKNYFLFRVFSVILWCLIPLLALFIPYSQTMFIAVSVTLLFYLIVSNILMEVEV